MPKKGYKMPDRYREVRRQAALHSDGFGKHPNSHKEEDQAGRWKGDKVGYFGLHKWVKKHLGKPTTCEHCGKSGLTRHKIHWANKSREYKRDLEDWLRLCVSCHYHYDRGKT